MLKEVVIVSLMVALGNVKYQVALATSVVEVCVKRMAHIKTARTELAVHADYICRDCLFI